ncbi:MAG: HEPN domain-containing protein [Chloroflexi bacterium]|nr:HEPN domain-containing protein [Chloroflexota bacterium]
MKSKTDLVKGWLKKADSDIASARTCLASNEALDTVCFHSQQAAEKSLKAYLIANDIDFPFIHNLEKLIELCAEHEEAFRTLKPMAQELTPYAVELRYDYEFWPSAETAQKALNSAIAIRAFVLERLSMELNEG